MKAIVLIYCWIDYVGHIHTRRADLSAVIICDKDYPRRVAFAVLNEVLDSFIRDVPKDRWASTPTYGKLRELIDKYQDPHQADSLLRVQKELDETKIIMHKTIEAVLERGERLEDLVDRSNELSTASKAFYKTAKSTNSCCKIM